MTTATVIRFACILALWLLLCYVYIKAQPLTLWSLFWLVASGIIVFVPLYKKYVRKTKQDGGKQ